LIIDSHLDLSWNALSWNRDITQSIAQVRQAEADMSDDDARGHGTVTLPEMRRAGVAVCCGTFLTRAKRHVKPTRKIEIDVATQEIACATARGQLAYYRLLAEQNEIAIITNQRELRSHFSRWQAAGAATEAGAATSALPVGLILAMEGADPIVSPAQAQAWWADGLRSVGLAHYGKSHYAVGTGDDGPLTPKGVELLKEFDRLGMILDATHSSDQSFFQAMDLFAGPVMASHNNCRALVPGDRQFADEQIKLLLQRNAVIGVALDSWMLHPGFVIGKTHGSIVPLASVVDHIDHICQLAGDAKHVAIGTDLDGGFGTEQSPAGLETIADLQKLDEILASRGYAAPDIDNIFHGNWLRFFLEALPAQ
jgi:membrane dipeptidase